VEEQQKEQLRTVEGALRTLLDAGTLNEDAYQKNLVELAYEWALADEMDEAVRLLSTCLPSYFADVQPGQMEEDDRYAQIAYDLATLLVEKGKVGDGKSFYFGSRGSA
jgi:hypothetical protein